MTLLVTLLVANLSLASGPDATAFGPLARVTSDASGAHVVSLTRLDLPLADTSLAGLRLGFFAQHQARLGVDPAELVEIGREQAGALTVVSLRRVVGGVPAVDSLFRVTLSSGAVKGYTARDSFQPLVVPSRIITHTAAREAALKALPGLVGGGQVRPVFQRGRYCLEVRFLPNARGHAPVVYVDGVSGEVLGLANGLVR
jgi:hypothetical protein